MIESNFLHYAPAILKFRELAGRSQFSGIQLDLDSPVSAGLLQDCATQVQVETILRQRLFGTLSISTAVEEISLNAEQSALLNSVPPQPQISQSHLGAGQPNVMEKEGESTLNGMAKQSEQFSSPIGPDEQNHPSQADAAVASINRLWARYQNESADKQSLAVVAVPQNHQLGHQGLKTGFIRPSTNQPSHETAAQSSADILHQFRQVFKQIESGQDALSRAQRPFSSTHFQAPSLDFQTTGHLGIETDEHGNASDTVTSKTQALNELVDDLWQQPAETGSGKIPVRFRSADAPITNAKNAKARTSALAIGGHFRGEVDQLVNSLGLKPLGSANSDAPEKNGQKIYDKGLTAAIDESELVETVNRLLLAQARRNGVDI